MTKQELEKLASVLEQLADANGAKQTASTKKATTAKKASKNIDAETMREMEIAAELGAEATAFISTVLKLSEERIKAADKITAEQGLKIVAGKQTLALMLEAVLDMALIREEFKQSAITASNTLIKQELND